MRHAFSLPSCAAALAYAATAAAQETKVEHRHFRLDRLRAAHARQGSRHLQEERPRRVDQEDPAEGPPPRDRLGRRPVRGDDRRDLDRLERQRRARPSRSSSWTRATAPTAWRCATTSRKIADLKGKTVAASAPGTAPVLHARVVPEEERPVGEGRHASSTSSPRPAAQAFVAGQNDAAMTYEPYLSTRARQPAGRQDHRDHARLPDDHGHVRLHAEVPRRQPEGREGAGRQLLRGARHDQEGPEEELRDHGRRRKQTGEQFEAVGRSTCAGRTRRRTRNSSPASSSSSARKRRTCCSRSASSSQLPDLSKLADTRFIVGRLSCGSGSS